MGEFARSLLALLGALGLIGLVIIILVGPLMFAAMLLTYGTRVLTGRRPKFVALGTVFLAISSFVIWFFVGCIEIAHAMHYPRNMLGWTACMSCYGLIIAGSVVIAGMSIANIVTDP